MNERYVMYIGDIGHWQFVGGFSTLQEALDEIQFPSFEWSEGLLVTVQEIQETICRFEGIFNSQECINVSGGSDVMTDIYSGWSDSVISSDVGLIAAYENCKDPLELMKVFARWMMRDEVIRAYCKCLDFVPRLAGTQACVDTVLKFLHGEASKKDVLNQSIEMLDRINNMPNRANNLDKIHIYYAYLRCAELAESDSYSSEYVWQRFETIIQAIQSLYRRKEAEAAIVKQLRECLPFRQIAMRIVSA